MALDPSIILGVRPMADPMESAGRAMTLAQLAQTGRMQQMQLQQAEREQRDQQTLADLYRGAIGADGKLDRGVLLQGAASRGLGAKIPGLQKQLLDADKAGVDLEKVRAETAGLNYGQLQKRVEATNGALTSLLARPQVSHQDVLGAMQGLVQQGLAKPEEVQAALAQMPQDPTQLRPYLEQKRLEGLTAAERLKALTPDMQSVNTGKVTQWVDKNPLTNPGGPAPLQMTTTPDADMVDRRAREEGAANRAVTVRGQNLVDARARETAAQGKWQYDGERGGLVNLQTGEFKPATQAGAPVGPKDKALTEGQAKANLFGTRMQEADKIIGELATDGVTQPSLLKRAFAATPLVGGVLGMGANEMASGGQQRVEQAQRDFINAVLRRESGAAIAESEFANAAQQYFPQPGDKPETVAQKARNRQIAIQGLLAEVPEGKRTAPPPAPAAAPKAPKVGAVDGGYLYTGGDPADPKSWKKVGK